MRLSDPDTIDYLGLEKGTGCIVVTLVDDCDWQDELQHLALLQAKVNRYFDFMESGEVYQQLAATTGHKVTPAAQVKLNILAKHEPTDEGHRFLDQVSKVASEAGVSFAFKVLSM